MMIRNFLVIITFCFLISSCGKKNDPIFNEENNNTKIQVNQINRSA